MSHWAVVMQEKPASRESLVGIVVIAGYVGNRCRRSLWAQGSTEGARANPVARPGLLAGVLLQGEKPHFPP